MVPSNLTKLTNLIAAAASLTVYAVLSATEAYAWGPATHIQLAHEVLADLAWLPASVAGILTRYAADFIFGNIAADVVFAKKKTRIKQICHQWPTGFALLDQARGDSGRAFAYGYLSHLAADTVAHNKFIPRQIMLNGTTRNFGHLYWEMRADLSVDPQYWKAFRRFVRRRFAEHEAHMATRLTGTLLSFDNNLRLFHRVNGLVSRKAFRRSMTVWDRLSRYDLCDRLVAGYRLESLDRIHSVLADGRSSAVSSEDPNGNRALHKIRLHRRHLRRLARRGFPVSARLADLIEGHAPDPKKRSRLPAPQKSGGPIRAAG